jgi:uncharacterized protein YceK
MKNTFLFMLVTLLLSGCNSVSYQHSERIGISVEGKTADPQQPLQGNIGVKSRTILVVPGQTTTGSGEPGEATSAISDFHFDRAKSEGFPDMGTTTIKSAFITGDAAKNSTNKSAAALAISGRSVSTRAMKRGLTRTIYNMLTRLDSAGEIAAKQLVRDFDKFAVYVPQHYATMQYWDVKAGKFVSRDTSLGIASTGFKRVSYYLSDVDGTINALSDLIAGSVNRFDGSTPNKPELEIFKVNKVLLESERASIETLIAKDTSYKDAIDYLFKE